MTIQQYAQEAAQSAVDAHGAQTPTARASLEFLISLREDDDTPEARDQENELCRIVISYDLRQQFAAHYGLELAKLQAVQA